MPDLITSLLNHDLGHLRIIAGLWGLELESNETDLAREELSASLLDFELVAELMDSLSPTERTAITALASSSGRIAWSTFTRRYGDIREMGAGKRDRERPHLKPASTAETLFYRGLLARAFFDTEKGPQEFAYIPDDLLAIINREEKKEESDALRPKGVSKGGKMPGEELGREAIPAEKAHVIPSNDHILDDAATLLAALRMGRSDWQSDPRLCALLIAAKLINKNILQAEAVKNFLEAPRADALNMLVEAWRSSSTFDELRLIPGIICEGEWTNTALNTRNSMFGFLETVHQNKWWNLSSFVKAIKEKHPDFQRPASDYDSWFIKRASDGLYLRGFEHWDEVDGALIRFFITDVMFALGLVDLAKAKEDGVFTAFRLSSFLSEKKEERGKIIISSNGKITIPALVPRAARYQLARFCEWDDEKPDEYRYHITPRSLMKAKESGLKVEHLLPLLAKHSGGIPPVLVKALKRWEINGTEARAETQVILRVSRPEVLEELRLRSKAARFLGEVLSPTAVVIKAGAQSKVMAALAELGFLAADESRKNE